MTDGTCSSDLHGLLRWQYSGGTWRVLTIRDDAVTVSLCRCDDETEEVDRLISTEPDLIAFARLHLGQDSD